jgi:hypothetical protein
MNQRIVFQNFFNHTFTLLDKKKDRVLLIIICLIFSIIFLNIFVPFNINRWYSDSGFIQFIRLSGYGVVVAGVLIFTQFPLRKIFRVDTFKISTFILWFSLEIVLISLIYIFMYGNPLGNFMNELTFSVKYTLAGVCLPYSLSLLLIHYKNQHHEVQSLKIQMNKPEGPPFIGFKDEKGKIRFSVLMKDLLFMESADNYVCVYYLSGGKAKRKILRNSLKNLGESLKGHSVERCHRSFIVNKENVEMAEKKGKKVFLRLKESDRLIPVSKTYFHTFLQYF